jgi:hypothetical protein
LQESTISSAAKMVRRIYLLSNDSTKEYPNNTLTDFTNILPRELGFRRKVRQCIELEMLSFSANFVCIPETIRKVKNHMTIKIEPMSEAAKSIARSLDKKKIVVKINRNICSTTDLMAYLSNVLGGKYRHFVTFLYKDGIFTLYLNECTVNIHEDFANWLNLEIGLMDEIIHKRYDIATQYWEIEALEKLEITCGLRNLKFEPTVPDYIRVEVDHVLDIKGSERCVNTLAVIPYRKGMKKDSEEEGTHTFYHEIGTVEKCAFNFRDHRNLRCRLLDEKGKQLDILPGQPSIIRLCMRKMARNSFLLRLSTLDKGASGSNSDCRFVLQEPLKFKLRQIWEMALTSVTLKPDFLPYVRDDQVPWQEQDISVIIKRGTRVLSKTYLLDKVEFFKNTPTLIARLNNLIQSEYPTIQIKDNVGYLTVNVLKKPSKPGKEEEPLEVKIVFTPELGYILGITPSLVDQYNVEKFPQINVMEGAMYTCSEKINFERLFPNHVLVYVDVIKETIVGSSQQRIIKFVPVRKGEIFTYESEHLEFVRIRQNFTPVIHIWLGSIGGRTIECKNPKSEILYNFIVRKRASNRK